MLDLVESKTLNTLELVNTHDGPVRGRCTKDFQVFLGQTIDGPWQQIINSSLEDTRWHTDPLPLKKFSFQAELNNHGFI